MYRNRRRNLQSHCAIQILNNFFSLGEISPPKIINITEIEKAIMKFYLLNKCKSDVYNNEDIHSSQTYKTIIKITIKPAKTIKN
jgi:hypothetical protein